MDVCIFGLGGVATSVGNNSMDSYCSIGGEKIFIEIDI